GVGVGAPQGETAFAGGPRSPPGPSSVDSPLYAAILTVAGRMAPGAPVVPYMSPGGTDSQVLRARGVAAYGLLPFPIREDDLRTMHANDERIGTRAFAFGTEMIYRVVLEAAR